MGAGVPLPKAAGPVVTANEFPAPEYSGRFADFVHPPPLSTITGQLVQDLIPMDCNQDCNLDGDGVTGCVMDIDAHPIREFLLAQAATALSDGEGSGGWKDVLRKEVHH
jgi:hypothetical protein